MKPEEQWELVRGGRGFSIEEAGMGALRVALLFGSAAVAFALLAVPLLDSRTRTRVARADLDMTTTGSIGGGTTKYTIRRSVLQASPNAVCIIRENDARRGNC
jgi:hypothetical protein